MSSAVSPSPQRRAADQVLFVDLGPVEGRGDRVITALGQAYSPFDSPCIIVDGEPESAAKS